jgi:hypothetical protein
VGTLTCEAAATVLHKRQIVVGRGETLEFRDLRQWSGPSSRTAPDPAFACFEATLASRLTHVPLMPQGPRVRRRPR